MEVLRFELYQRNATDLQSAPALQLLRTSYTEQSGLHGDKNGTRTHKNSVADCRLTLQPSCLSWKKWELNPHESLAPNGFQDRGHHQLLFLFCWRRENRTHTISVKSRVLYPIKLHVNVWFPICQWSKKGIFFKMPFSNSFMYYILQHMFILLIKDINSFFGFYASDKSRI